MTNEPGFCPKCNHDDLEYGKAESHDECIVYPFVCKKCKFKGAEWYNTSFREFTDENGDALS